MKEKGVEAAICDQCQYGSEDLQGSPIKKPTKFLTNAPELAKELKARCSGRSGECSRPERGQHAQCRGKTARMAAVYHFKLCRAILVGFRNQLRCDGAYKDGFVGMLEAGQEQETLPGNCCGSVGLVDSVYELRGDSGEVMKVQIEHEPVFRDDLTGQLLDPALVKLARAKELEYFDAKCVWEKRALGEARRVTGKPPVTVRWVDVNKGDNQNPNIRSRLVACLLYTSPSPRDSR